MTDLLKLGKLEALAERVEAGKKIPEDTYKIAAAIFDVPSVFITNTIIRQVDSALNGSLDAAKALHNAVLPGWTIYWEHDTGHGPGLPYSFFALQRGDMDHANPENKEFTGRANTPAAAWVAAILRAKHNEEKDLT